MKESRPPQGNLQYFGKEKRAATFEWVASSMGDCRLLGQLGLNLPNEVLNFVPDG